jgi:outer membrane biosynthesis protein TonB
MALVFNPALNNPPKASLTPLTDRADEGRDSLFSPPRVLQVTYPRYPIQSVAQGTVVLELTVSAVGKIEAIKTVRDIASLTPEALDAMKGWKFDHAVFNAKPVPSTVVVAFLFRRPLYPDTR